MIFPLSDKQMRVSDAFGQGHFGAPRGVRKHKGVDYIAIVGASVISPVNGVITKYGWAYASNPDQRYIEITDADNVKHRLFYTYLSLNINVGTYVTMGEYVGRIGNISAMYDTDKKKMINHLHYEIVEDGIHVDAELYYEKKNLDLEVKTDLKPKLNLLVWVLVPSFIIALYLYFESTKST
jgi:murein DD-endopeptidase MepM/ murein hydrolase activator NlpD